MTAFPKSILTILTMTTLTMTILRLLYYSNATAPNVRLMPINIIIEQPNPLVFVVMGISATFLDTFRSYRQEKRSSSCDRQRSRSWTKAAVRKDRRFYYVTNVSNVSLSIPLFVTLRPYRA